MNKAIKISKIILKYENDFKGSLKNQYEDDKEFLKDLINNIETDGVNDILEFYRSYLISSNDTNSTVKQRKELTELILILEGQL